MKRLGVTLINLREREAPPLRLRSVTRAGTGAKLRSAPRREQHRRQVRENYAEGAKAIQAARGVWHQRRFARRVQLTRSIRALTPRGTVGEQVRRQLPEECSSCDERTKKNRPEAAKFANKRLKRLTFVPVKPELTPLLQKYHVPKTKKAKKKVVEEDDEPDTTNPVNKKKDGPPDQSDGDGDSPDWGADDSCAAAVAAN